MCRREAAHDEHELAWATGHRRSAAPKLAVVLSQPTRGLLRVAHVRARAYRTAQHVHALSIATISLVLFCLRIDECCVVRLGIIVLLVVFIEVSLAY